MTSSDNSMDLKSYIYDLESDKFYHLKSDIYLSNTAMKRIFGAELWGFSKFLIENAAVINKWYEPSGFFTKDGMDYYNINKIKPLDKDKVCSDDVYSEFVRWFLSDNTPKDLDLFIIAIKEKFRQVFGLTQEYNEVILDFTGKQGTGKSSLAQAIGTCFGSYKSCRLDSDNQFNSQYYDAPVCILDECNLYPKDYDFLKNLTLSQPNCNAKNKPTLSIQNKTLFIITHNDNTFYNTIDRDDRRLKSFIFNTKIDGDLRKNLSSVINYILYKQPLVIDKLIIKESDTDYNKLVGTILSAQKTDIQWQKINKNNNELEYFFDYLNNFLGYRFKITTQMIRDLGFKDWRDMKRILVKHDFKNVYSERIPDATGNYYLFKFKNHNNTLKKVIDDNFISEAQSFKSNKKDKEDIIF